jgi:hypothetical protein
MTSTRTLPTPPPAPPASAGRGARTIARRPGLPGGRAVVGALLVVTAGVGTFTFGGRGDDGPSTRFPVLVHRIEPGEPITEDDVAWRPMDLDPDVAARSFVEGSDLAGALALVPMSGGELLQRGDVATGDAAAPTPAQLTIPVPVERTPPDLRRGERITLLATYGSGDSSTTVNTVHAATVLAYDTDGESLGSRDRGRLTLALDDPNALIAAAHAAQVAELTVVRTTGAAAPIPDLFRRDVAGPHEGAQP